jgi:hypothetical protein
VAADVAKIDLPTKAGGRSRIVYAPDSLKLLYLDPVKWRPGYRGREDRGIVIPELSAVLRGRELT